MNITSEKSRKALFHNTALAGFKNDMFRRFSSYIMSFFSNYGVTYSGFRYESVLLKLRIAQVR